MIPLFLLAFSLLAPLAQAQDPWEDLLFFSDSSQQVGHVAVYLGRGYMLHAWGRVGRVSIDPRTVLRGAYVGARRVVLR